MVSENISPPPRPPYSVILADPPWRYSCWSDSKNGAQAAQYDGMKLEELEALAGPVKGWADAESCVLFLWTTWPKLNEGIDLLNAWGFRYVTGFPWIKTVPSNGTIRRGNGFWAMQASEPFLIGVTGKPRRMRKNPVIGLLSGVPPVFYAPRTRHSKKPEELQTWIERMLPDATRRLELFARRIRPGWDCIGLDTGWHISPRGAGHAPPTDDAPADVQMEMFH